MTDTNFYRAIHACEETEFARTARTIHVHGRAKKEFALGFTGGGAHVTVDLPLSVIPALIEALQALQADAEKRGMLAAIARTADAARFHEVAAGYREEIAE